MKIVDQLYSFELDGDWIETTSDQPHTRTIRSPDKRSQITSSAQQLLLAPGELQPFAAKYMHARLDGERAVAAGTGIGKLTIAQPQTIQRPWGYALAYFGADDSGRNFNFTGAITRNALIAVYAENRSGAQAEVFSIMRSIATSLQFDRTPLATGSQPSDRSKA